ncbi:MAG: acetyl-CoA carboxylase biotin carboxyl carrier protein [Nitrospirae bacterium]|nr:acetyl-CoA carboxylase biotin carboxyl carrier protein [Nitrospirota bacterium]
MTRPPKTETEPVIETLQDLLRLIQGTDVLELDVKDGTKRIHIKRAGAFASSAAPTTGTPPLSPPPPPGSTAASGLSQTRLELEPGQVLVSSPLVGTFYRAPSPGAKAFVEVGDKVKKGQTLCIVEAMKLMNEIQCEFDGEVHNVLRENGTTVEYGEPLMVLKRQ